MAVNLWGLTFGDDGTTFVVPPYAPLREAASTQIRQLRGIANLNTAPGSFFGNMIDSTVTGVDVALQGAQVVSQRCLFNQMQGDQLDAFLADYITRVPARASTAVAYAYGSAGAAFNSGTLLRTSANGPAFATDGNVVVPVVPALAYVVEVTAFATGAYGGQAFTITVAGFPAVVVPTFADDGFETRNALVDEVNATAADNALTITAWRGGLSPQNGRYAIVVAQTGGGGTFALAVAGPALQILSFPAVASPATAQVAGPTPCPPEALRYLSLPAGIAGATNPQDGVAGRNAETDSQLRARHMIAQRGMGGGSPDAIRAIQLSQVDVGGGGAAFCAVEYNPGDDNPDAAGNVAHSVRVVVDQDADGDAVGLALWKGKAAGDNTNGPEVVVVMDAGVPPAPQVVLIDRLTDVWFGIDVEVVVGPDWPNTGDPLAQLRQDVADYVEALQPVSNGGAVSVILLPIAKTPAGTERGVLAFRVRVGSGPSPGGPFAYNDYYPVPEPDAEVASITLTGRQKARCVVTDVTAVIV